MIFWAINLKTYQILQMAEDTLTTMVSK